MKPAIILFCSIILFSCNSKNEENKIKTETSVSKITNDTILNDSVSKTETDQPFCDLPTINMRYVLANKLNIRSGFSLTDPVLATLVMGDSINFLKEKGNDKIEIVWQGVLYSGYMWNVRLKDGTIGWAYGPMLGKKKDLEGHKNAVELREKFPVLAEYEGWYSDFQTDSNTKEKYILNGCYCGYTGSSIAFHYQGFKIDNPKFTTFSCGEAYEIEITKVKKTTYDGLDALLLEGHDHNKNSNQITIFNTSIDDQKVLGYHYQESDKPRYVISDRNIDGIKVRHEECEE